MINVYTKTDMESSPYIAAIQSLRGKTPGEKRRDFNAIVERVIEETKGHGEIVNTDQIREISPALTPLIRVIVGVKLIVNELVIEGLRSENTSVVKIALEADWFFSGANPTNVKYFVDDIMPYVSLRTRYGIIKKLSRSLIGHEKKAEEFFDTFSVMYGVEQSLPLLTACSEDFIFKSILKYKIVLPTKVTNILYSKHPGLIISYLQLGNKKNIDNIEDRGSHEIDINNYDTFITKLIKYHSDVFVELYKLTPEKMLKLGCTRAKIFLRNHKDVLIKQPKIFLKILPLKLVSKYLDKHSFDMMYENLFPDDVNDFNLNEMLGYIKYYKHGEKFQLLKDKFKKVYGQSLLEFELHAQSPDLMKILPKNDRENRAKILITKNKSANADVLTSFLHPRDALPYFKRKIANTPSAEKRLDFIGKMILSCSMHESNEDLLEVLEYFNKQHKNEQNFVLCDFFQYLKQEFDLKSLDENQWLVLYNIINYAHVKKELFKSHISLMESVLETGLHHSVNSKDNMSYFNKIMDIIVECKIEQSSPSWNVLKDNQEMEKMCLQKFFELIPIKYPENHAVWKRTNDKLALTLNIVKSIHDFNERNVRAHSKKKSKKNPALKVPVEHLIKIEDYPWILNLTDEFFANTEIRSSYRNKRLMSLLKINAPEFYENKMDEYHIIRDIESGEALLLLKRNPRKILANWSAYLAEAREKLHDGSKAARRFVAATKWHQDIPVKFIEKSLEDIKAIGSILVLGILLEGEAFEKLIAPFAPKEGTIDPNKKNAKEEFEFTRSIIIAMKYTNPPVSLDVISSFCQGDYVSLAEGTLMSIAQKIPVDKVFAFAKQLVDKPVSVKKLGIRLVEKVATKAGMRKFLEELWATENQPTVRQVISKTVFNIFVKSPNSDNWILMKNCIHGLTIDDKSSLEKFCDIEKINTSFLADYVKHYLNKIENLTSLGLEFKFRTHYVCMIIECFDDKLINFLPEATSLMIINRYFFDTDSTEISRAARFFALRSYLLPAGEKFESRLNDILNMLKKMMELFDTPHSKKKRFYPANYAIHEFFRDLLIEIPCDKSEESLQIIEKMIKVFTSILSPWQESESYMSLNLFKEYLLSNTPKNFGTRCANRVVSLIQEVSANESIIGDIAKCLEAIVNKIFPEIRNPLKLTIIEGLMEGDDFYGALLTIKLLNYKDVDSYDERYDKIIDSLKKKQNLTTQYYLYKHINRIEHYEM